MSGGGVKIFKDLKKCDSKETKIMFKCILLLFDLDFVPFLKKASLFFSVSF